MTEYTEYELTPQFDSRKSFYGKAHVRISQGDTKDLRSYNTVVSRITSEGAEVYGEYHSQTTMRHIKEFLKQNGYAADSKAHILKNYGVDYHED